MSRIIVSYKNKMKTIRIYITGSVQGVFFRKFLEEKANELNVRGFCRNLSDGRVEVVAEGRDEKVNEFVELCREGPKQAQIMNVNVEEIKHQGLKGFKILRM